MITIALTTSCKVVLTNTGTTWYVSCEPFDIINHKLLSNDVRNAKLEALKHVRRSISGMISTATKYVDVYK